MKLFCPISGNKKYNEMCLQNTERLGHIIGPSYYQKPKDGIRFVLDNDAFRYWREQKPFGLKAWLEMIRKIENIGRIPDWVVIPDVVGDWVATLKNWSVYSPMIHWPKAFVLQDGIKIGDVPMADIYFVGGTTSFKWSTAAFWCKHLSRVHIGRVRSRRLLYCDKIEAESCDGSGWLRESVNGRPFKQLEAWLEDCNHQHEFNLEGI